MYSYAEIMNLKLDYFYSLLENAILYRLFLFPKFCCQNTNWINYCFVKSCLTETFTLWNRISECSNVKKSIGQRPLKSFEGFERKTVNLNWGPLVVNMRIFFFELHKERGLLSHKLCHLINISLSKTRKEVWCRRNRTITKLLNCNIDVLIQPYGQIRFLKIDNRNLQSKRLSSQHNTR